MKNHVLIGCIEELGKVIKTRYFYLNRETNELKDVTFPLYQRICVFNQVAQAKKEKGEYSLIIPYDYSNGLVKYSFGCGLSHYLQPSVFSLLTSEFEGDIGFPLDECLLDMYVPTDVSDILKVSGVFDEYIFKALLNRY